MSARAWALQKAVYAALAADAGVKAELGDPPRIHDEPPRNAVFPYAVLGEGRVAPLPGHDGAFVHEIRILIVSRHGGRREVKRALDALVGALHEADFPVEDGRLVSIAFSGADIPRRRGGEPFEGAARFRAVTEAA
ncbi:MAG: hypothetical protein Kow00133_14060 [Amphiplicatus sp.]